MRILKIAARRATAPVRTRTIKAIAAVTTNVKSSFTFLPPKAALARKGKKKHSNAKARKNFIQRT